VTSLELSDAKGFLPIQHRTHWGTGDLLGCVMFWWGGKSNRFESKNVTNSKSSMLGSKTRPQKSKRVGGEALAW